MTPDDRFRRNPAAFTSSNLSQRLICGIRHIVLYVDDLCVVPGDRVPLDPDEFLGALKYCLMVADCGFTEEIPRLSAKICIGQWTFQLTNCNQNRFCLAAIRFFRGRIDKGVSFLRRENALKKIFESEQAKAFREKHSKSDDISAFIEAAATWELDGHYEFCPEKFLPLFRQMERNRNNLDKPRDS